MEKTEKKTLPIISPSNFLKKKEQRRKYSDISLNSPQTVNVSTYLNTSSTPIHNLENSEDEVKTVQERNHNKHGKQKRSQELYKNRKNMIFSAIFEYLCEEKPLPPP